MTVLVIHAQSVEKRRSNTTRTSYNGTSTLTRFVGRSAGEETPHHDVAFVGLIANVVGTVLLKRGSNENMNIRAAQIHLLSDAVSSLAVITGAVFIIFFNIGWIDPTLTILIALYILKETYDIVRESVDVIMMSTPPDIDINTVQQALQAIPGVRNIHHVHLWKMNDADTHCEAHSDVDDLPVSGTAAIRVEIERCLHDRYDINHTTLQFECDSCQTKGLL